MLLSFLRKTKQKITNTYAVSAAEAKPVPTREDNKEQFFITPPTQHELNGGYSEVSLNEYIILKTKKWFESYDSSNFKILTHLSALLFVLETIFLTKNAKLNIVDFGGGIPITPWLAKKIGLSLFDSYRIIEQEIFLKKIPADWGSFAAYGSDWGTDITDVVVISSVLPYITTDQANDLFNKIEIKKPHYIYFGRTAFLPEDFEFDEIYTVQEAIFKDHGPQIQTDLIELEQNIARYSRRLFKRSTVERRLREMKYQQKLVISDDSGMPQISGISLYSHNALWELSH